MRGLYLVFLLAVGGAAGVLAYENQQQVTLTVWQNSITTSIPVLVGLTYVAGMLSGWTVVGLIRRSVYRVLRDPLPGEYAATR